MIDLNQPQIAAALVGGSVAAVVSVSVAIVAQIFSYRMHKQKIAADSDLAERKFRFDRDLAEQKFDYDRDLTERRFRFDRELHDHKRRVEFAEALLAQFYQARDVVKEIRSPFGFVGEGAQRPRNENETEEQRRELDMRYTTLERMNKHSEFISSLFSKRYQARAIFGSAADEAFSTLEDVILTVRGAAMTLLGMAQRGSTYKDSNAKLRERLEGEVWGLESDDLGSRVSSAIASIEAVCRPILEGKPSE